MIDAAILLMRRAGLSGAGINQIIKQSGTPKGSVYYHFPQGKEQLIREALAVYGELVVQSWEKTLAIDASPSGKIQALFDSVALGVERGQFRQSCAAGAVCLDLDGNADLIRQAVASVFERWVQVLSTHFQLQGEKARTYAGLVLTMIEGAFIRARAEKSTQSFHEAASWLTTALENELKRPAQKKRSQNQRKRVR